MDRFTGESGQTFQEEIIVILHKFFQNIEDEEIVPNLCYGVNTTQTLKPDKAYFKKEKY